MKHLGIFIVVFLAFSVKPAHSQVRLRGNIQNASDTEYVYLYSFFGRQLQKFDSTRLRSPFFKPKKNKTFKFKYKSIPRGFYQIGDGDDKSTTLVLGKESLSIDLDFNNIENTFNVYNSVENDLFKDFKEINQLTFESLKALNASKSQSEIEQASYLVKSDSIIQIRQSFYDSIAKNNPHSFMGKVAMTILDDTLKNYFKNIDFHDDELTRGDMLATRIYNYFSNHVPRNVNAWLEEYQKIIEMTSPKSKQRELAYISLVQLFNSAIPSEVKGLAISYQKEYPNSIYSNSLLESMPAGAPSIGEMAPNISLKNKNGEVQELASLKGQVVLLDFWASWCGPCRQENPNVVKAYKKYKEKGFTVYGVSLDRSKEKWLKAIEKDNLDWHHVSDLSGWQSTGAATYQVRGIPATFLIGKDGRIIGKNLRGKALEEKLKEVLN